MLYARNTLSGCTRLCDWLTHPDGIGAVSRGHMAIFFRDKPAICACDYWLFAEDIEATYSELKSLGANIVEPLEKKPWGLRQFTVEDSDGNRFSPMRSAGNVGGRWRPGVPDELRIAMMPRILEIAMQTAISRRGVAVIAFPETSL